MNKTHPKYKITPVDTIQSISLKFGVEEDIWKNYHNNMCRLNEVVRDELPPELEIYLLPELWEKADDLIYSTNDIVEPKNNNKISWGYQKSFPIKKNLYISKKHGISIQIHNGNKSTNIKYEISTEWQTLDEKYTARVERISPVYINNLLPDLMITRLSVDVFNIINPFIFELNKNGQIVDIHNFEEIQQRWENNKNELNKKRQGEVFEKYLRLFSHTLSRKSLFLNKISNDWALYTLFFGIYQIYGSQFSLERIIHFPFIQNAKGIQYNVIQQISEFLNNDRMIKITVDGKVTDTRNIKDFEYGQDETVMTDSPKLAGVCNAVYIVNPQTNIPETIRAEYTLDLDEKKTIIIKISSLN